MTDPLLPVDQGSRDAIRGRIGETLFVEAGAGTGKTHELVQRVVGLVAAGTPLSAIAAITFTNAAAAELRDRVRLELERAARTGFASYAHLTSAERERCADALATIDAAVILTLHSFAQRILALYPIEAGLPPELDQRDEVAASIAFDDRWQAFLEDLLDDGAGDPEVASALVRAFMLDIRADQLRAIALRFHQEWDRILPAKFARPEAPPVDASAVIAELAAAAELAGQLVPGATSDKAYESLLRQAPLLAQLRVAQTSLDSARTEEERLPAEEQIMRLLSPRDIRQTTIIRNGQRKNWNNGALDELKAAASCAEEARTELMDGLRGACLGVLLGAIQRFVREYRDDRVRDGTLEFHDLLFLARDLLKANVDVRRDLARRYQALLIDEFQDTDPIQIEIAVLIASDDPDAGAKPWDEVEVKPGRLFFVGDPKQSIYRFRRADIELYTAAARKFGTPPSGSTLPLTQNFRSVPSIIEWVNQVFAALFTLDRRAPESGAVEQVAFEPLAASRPDTSSSPAVYLLGGPIAKADVPDADAGRVEEANGIARLVAEIRAAGGMGRWEVDDKHAGTGGSRPARYSDIAILMPTRNTLAAIEQALNQSGIPCRIEARSLLFETQEVRDLLAILAAIEDPTDEVAVVAALRSPGFGCNDRDLWEFAAAHGSWDYRHDAPEGYPPDGSVAQAMAALRAFNEQRWWIDAAGMIDLVIRERRLYQVAFATRRPRESWQRLRFVHEQARAFSKSGGRSLRQFVRYMELQADEQARLTETAVAEDDDDAVRIMTVHASKGLEFPIVILAGLNVKPNNMPDVVLWQPDGQPEVRVGRFGSYFATPGYDAIKQREEAMERLEDDRLLYVAATRARDHLVASVYHLESSTPHPERHGRNGCTAAACLYALNVDVPGLWQAAEPPETGQSYPHRTPDSGQHRDSPADRDAWLAERTALIAAGARMPVLAATSIARSAGANVRDKDEQTEDEAPWKKGRAGTSVGRAVHAVLQTIDLVTGEGIEAAASAQAVAEGVEDRRGDVVAYARAALHSAAVREAVASGRFWREVYVSAHVEGVTIEGFIDLLYETPEGLVVVDYKTDTLANDAEIEASMARYRLQGAAYALALMESLGRPVVRCVFVFVQPRQERAIADLEFAIEDVRRAVPAAFAASVPT